MTRISAWGHKIYASICDVSPLSLSSAVISLVMFTYSYLSTNLKIALLLLIRILINSLSRNGISSFSISVPFRHYTLRRIVCAVACHYSVPHFAKLPFAPTPHSFPEAFPLSLSRILKHLLFWFLPF